MLNFVVFDLDVLELLIKIWKSLFNLNISSCLSTIILIVWCWNHRPSVSRVYAEIATLWSCMPAFPMLGYILVECSRCWLMMEQMISLLLTKVRIRDINRYVMKSNRMNQNWIILYLLKSRAPWVCRIDFIYHIIDNFICLHDLFRSSLVLFCVLHCLTPCYKAKHVLPYLNIS